MPSDHRICFVSHNKHKLAEILQLAPEGSLIFGLDDLGLHEEIPETGATIEANATLKARYVYDRFHISCFADDTGLEVNALKGAPGVYSARYAGEEKDPVKNMQLVLQNLKGVKDRTARFKTIICYFDSRGTANAFEGIVNGKILEEPRGEAGFGYDPIFMPDGYDKTFAEMTLADKNKISHRSIAFNKFFSFLSSAHE